jgi:hypothetical protein
MPTNTEGLVVAVLALVPGYLLIRFASRRSFRTHPDSAIEWVLNSLAASLVIQILVSPVTLVTIYPVRDQILKDPDPLIKWLIVVVLVIPFALGRFISILRPWTTDRRAERHWWARWLSELLINDVADAWDWLDDHNRADHPRGEPTVDRPRLANLIWILELEGGKVLAGSGPEVVGLGKGSAIWLRKLWTLGGDDEHAEPIPGETGAVIPSSAIKAVRFRTRPPV